MDIVDGPANGDITIEKMGLKVFLEKSANNLLSSSTVDFSEERGFVVSGAQQTSCCG